MSLYLDFLKEEEVRLRQFVKRNNRLLGSKDKETLLQIYNRLRAEIKSVESKVECMK